MTERIGWTLVHFVWQGAAIAALYAMVRSGMQGSKPAARYVLGCVALAVMTIAPAATFINLGATQQLAAGTTIALRSHAAGNAAAMSIYGSFLYGNTLNDNTMKLDGAASLEHFLPWIVRLWLVGALVLWLRMVAGWAVAARMRSVAVVPAAARWQQTFGDLRRKVGLARPVGLLISSRVRTPAVIGWLRPVVLAPAATLAGLPTDQMEGLLLHELAHIRRHDYLVNILQSVAEAFLFYHPAVWWISGNIRAEREQCCDDIAVAATGDALTYAKALAELESRRAGHLAPALAAGGGSLSNRIARLLGQPTDEARNGLGAVGVTTGLIFVAAVSALHGQAPPRPQFEVASVKENPTFAGKLGGMNSPSPGVYRARNMTLRWLIRGAYNVNSFNIFGGPPWLDSAGFDIDAKTPVIPGQSQREALAEMNVMLQSVLEDRFRLKTHLETRGLPVYILTVAKSGLKMKRAPCDGREPSCLAQLQEARKTWPAPVSGSWGTMADFVVGLATTTNGGRMIVDRTGLSGIWDFHMQWVYRPPPAPAAGDTAAADDQESIFTALEKQLGLHLESGKGPVEVLMIDSAEKPSAN